MEFKFHNNLFNNPQWKMPALFRNTLKCLKKMETSRISNVSPPRSHAKQWHNPKKLKLTHKLLSKFAW